MRRRTSGLLGPRRATFIRARSASTGAACCLHVGEDRAFGARGHDRHGEPRDMDVCSSSGGPPFLDRQHSHDVVRSHEPPVAERHHSDVGSPRNVFFAHVHIVANVRSLSGLATAGRLPGRPPAVCEPTRARPRLTRDARAVGYVGSPRAAGARARDGSRPRPAPFRRDARGLTRVRRTMRRFRSRMRRRGDRR